MWFFQVQEQLWYLTSLTEDMKLHGFPTKSEITDFEVVTSEAVATKTESSMLGNRG